MGGRKLVNLARSKALHKLMPLGGYSATEKEVIIHKDGINNGYIMPTEQKILDTIAIIEAEEIATKYKRDRKAEYPSIGDQLDALWKGGVELEIMKTKILAVKEKYPKS